MSTVSWSEIRTFSQCSMKHYWRYIEELKPRVAQIAPSRGSAGHRALAAFYRGEDWRKELDNWLEEQIKDQELFDEEEIAFEKVVEEAKKIIPRYIATYAEAEAQWDILEVETEFEIPVRGYDATYVGYVDLLIKDSNDHVWVVEHKFPQRRFKKPERLELDGQLVLYQYAMKKLTGFDVNGVIYNQLLWKLPVKPSINKDGSVSRANIKSDWPTYRAALLEADEDPMDYLDMKDKLSRKDFFQRHRFYKNEDELSNYMQDINRRALTVLSENRHVYMNGSSSFLCPGCDFRDLCVEYIKGGDVEFLIERDFEHRERGR